MNHFLEGFRKYATFKGRTGRKGYWIFFVISYVLIQLVVFLEKSMNFPIMDVPFLTLIFSIFMYIPMISIGVRRMHDVGKSGWYYLIPFYNLYLCFLPSEPHANKWGEVPTDA